MRVAALYDVHGNIHALEAVLAEVARDKVDTVVVGGDVAWGPFPVETMERLVALGDRALWVRGNADREPGEWVAERLDDDRLRFLRELPDTQRVEVDGLGSTLFCHGSPRSDDEIITAITSESRLGSILGGVTENVVVCGHTHHQFDRVVDGIRVVNAGSVGMAYEGRPGAHWAVLGPDVDFRRTEFDFAAAAEALRTSGFPDAADYAETLYGSPPSAAEVAEHFERRALDAVS